MESILKKLGIEYDYKGKKTYDDKLKYIITLIDDSYSKRERSDSQEDDDDEILNKKPVKVV